MTDASGALMPGVTVTLSSPALLEPRVAVTSATGTYEFPGLPIGTYAVRFELAGFGSLVRDGLQLQSGFNAQVNGELQIAGLQEDVVVRGTSAIVDIRSTTQGTRFNVEELQAIPSTRDVFQVLTQTQASRRIVRTSVGPTTAANRHVLPRRGNGQGRWFVDGVDRNDIANGRPFVVDFNSVEEMQVSTGGADVTMQTPGVFVNVVTKSGSDAFRGATWFLRTDHNPAPPTSPTISAGRGPTPGIPSCTRTTTAVSWAGRSYRVAPGSSEPTGCRTFGWVSSTTTSRPPTARRFKRIRCRIHFLMSSIA